MTLHRIVFNDELRDLHRPCSIVKTVNCSRFWWSGCVARMGIT
jgi:hypothetical protein